MAKEQKVETPKEKTDFVKLVKDSVPSMGASSFVRVNLKEKITVDGLEDLNKEYTSQGYEVFANGKSVLLLKQ